MRYTSKSNNAQHKKERDIAMKKENEQILFKDYLTEETKDKTPKVINKNDIWLG